MVQAFNNWDCAAWPRDQDRVDARIKSNSANGMANFPLSMYGAEDNSSCKSLDQMEAIE